MKTMHLFSDRPTQYSKHFEISNVTKESIERVNKKELQRNLANPSQITRRKTALHNAAKTQKSYENVQRDSYHKMKEQMELLNKQNRISLAQHPLQESPILGGTRYTVRYDDEPSRTLLKKVMEAYTGHSYAWFKEERGFRNWVLYREDQFEITSLNTDRIDFMQSGIEIHYLHFKKDNVILTQNGNTLEQNNEIGDINNQIEFPINASSHFFMFSNVKFYSDKNFNQVPHEHNAKQSEIWYYGNSNGVIDFVGAFYNARFNGKFSFPNNYSTQDANKMDGMFYRAEFLSEAHLPNTFYTNKVVSMPYMFFGAFLHSDFQLPQNFSTVNVFDMEGMFCDCYLGNNTLGENFKTNKVINMAHMFDGTKVNIKNFRLPNNFSTDSLIYSKHMFYADSLGIQFYTKNKTNREIVRILKEWGSAGEPISTLVQ